MAYIYKITNKINNKIYIGKTNKTIDERYKEHCKESCRKRFKNRPLYCAINKYGIENFVVEKIEECNLENASEREIY